MADDAQAEERQARVARVIRAQAPAAPPALRTRIEADLARDRARGGWTRRRAPRIALAAAIAVVAVAVAVPLALQGDDAITVQEAVNPTHRDPAGPAPARDSRRPALLAASFAGVTYPDWRREFGWRPVGRRSDEIQGRATKTVFYEHRGHRIGYTVVAGPALDLPAGGRRVVRDGVTVHLYGASDGHDIAVFERGGRTCILAGHVRHRRTLAKLATWPGGGAVRFTS